MRALQHLSALAVLLVGAAATAKEPAKPAVKASAAALEAVRREALASTEAWLALVDAGKYDESWDRASSLFRSKVTREHWANAVRAARVPLGKKRERKHASSRYTESLSGAPDGAYVVIEFRSAFERKASAVEQVTPMRDDDGKWRVSGYFIR